MTQEAAKQTYERLTVDREGHVMRIGLNRASKRNAFDVQMLRELSIAMTEYEDNTELWCAVLYAHGEHFTAGLDLGEVGPSVAGGAPLFPEGHVDPLSLHGRVRTKPLVIAVQGWCLTIGIELMLASDICLAASDTRLGQIEIKRGIFPFGGATIRWPQVSGWGNAMRYLLTGDIFDAVEAHRIGLVQQVLSPETLHEQAFALADTIASQAPLGVQATLRSAQQVRLGQVPEAIDALIPQARTLMASEDAKEGLHSFLERRDAVFTGK
jgi:enoyl-CoA hydratase/carnithine racemase